MGVATVSANLSGDDSLVVDGATVLQSCWRELTAGGHFSGWLQVAVAANRTVPSVGQFCRPGYMGWCRKGAQLLPLPPIFSVLPSGSFLLLV